MLKKIQRATASSPEGTRGLVRGVLACAAQNIAFMLPTSLLYALVRDLMAGGAAGRTAFYVCGCVACFALILLTTWFQYNGTYFTTYQESGIRRLTLAERLRRLPLSFFGKRDLADLTSTIMADCEVLEKTCSHFIPGLFGSLISTVLIALGLFLFDWRMALAALWVIPVSAAIVLCSYRVQDRVQSRTMAVKMTCADGIQEFIESIRDLKASNAEQGYLGGREGSASGKKDDRGGADERRVRDLGRHGPEARHRLRGADRLRAAAERPHRRADAVPVPARGFPPV